MLTAARRLLIAPLAMLVLGVFATGLAGAAPQDAAASAVTSRQAFHDAMRTLWAGDHIVWTRCYIVSAATLPENLPDTGATADRLLFNQTEIGNAIKPFYGDAAGNALTALLRVHILTAVELIADAKAGDAAGVADAQARWYANAHDIAVFLHDANPRQWSVAELETLLDRHLDLTLNEAVARLQGRYTDDIAAYDSVHDEILQLADTLSAGIIAQFPQKFAR